MRLWKKGFCSLLVLCMVLSTVSIGAFAQEYRTFADRATAKAAPYDSEIVLSRPFLDVWREHWFFSAVHFVSARDIMRGTTEFHFAPNGSFSRAMVVATLFRIHHGRPACATDPLDTPFHDVPVTAWYAPYISWAHRNAIVGGLPDGRFAPQDAVARQEFATMLHRFVAALTDMDATVHEGPQWGDFVDSEAIAPWAYDALAWANYRGIITGRDDNQIAPRATATRAEAATMLTRFLGGNADAPPPPLPQNVNIATLLDAEFLPIWYIFGDLLSRPNAHWEMWRFRSGALIGVAEDGTIASIAIDFMQAGSGRFHFEGLNRNSTPDDVLAALGEPTVSDGISYVYWLGGEVFAGPNLAFFFDSHTGRVEAIGLMHMP